MPANVEVEANAYAEAKTETESRRSQAKTGVQADAKAKAQAAAELRVEAILTAEAGTIDTSDPIEAVAGRRRQWRQRHYSAGPA